MLLGSIFPNLEVDTTHGTLKLHEYQGKSWLMLFSHPADFTPVCTTELGGITDQMEEFNKRNVKLIALSCDSVDDHNGWCSDVMAFCGKPDENLPYPIIADEVREIGYKLGIIDERAKDAVGMPLTARAVFIIDPANKLRLAMTYPISTGRSIPYKFCFCPIIFFLQFSFHTEKYFE